MDTISLCLPSNPPVYHSSVMSGLKDLNIIKERIRQRKRLRAGKRQAEGPLMEEGKNPKRKAQHDNLETESAAMDDGDGVQIIETAIVEVAASVGDIVTTQSEAISTLNTQSDLIVSNSKEIDVLRCENRVLTKRLDNLEALQKSEKERLTGVEKTANQNAHTLKNSNIVIEGVLETPGEDCSVIACDIFKVIEKKCGLEDIVAAYRVGQASGNVKYVRPIVVKLTDPVIKSVLMEYKWKLTKLDGYNTVFLNDDLPPAIKKERRTLREISKFAHQLGYKGCKASGSKLMINQKIYRYDTLHLLPKELQLCNIKTRLVGDGLGFQGAASYLSNFYPVTFQMEGQNFNCAEQAYQFFRSTTCKRDDRARKIMDMTIPRDIKIAGDDVPSTAVWEQHKERFMRSVAYSKFSQNEEIMLKLINTEELPLYECTTNRWWGSGLHLDSPEWTTSKPPGLNKMGLILMDVRRSLRKKADKGSALTKSPGAIIRSVLKLDDEIQAGAAVVGATPIAPAPNVDIERDDKPTTGNDHPIEPSQHSTPQRKGAVDQIRADAIGGHEEEMETEVKDPTISSESDSEELMDPTDIDEDSVNISANLSTVSNESIANVTREDGKIDLEKIRGWKLPKIKDLNRTLNASAISERTRSQQLRNTLPSTSIENTQPQAESTPNPRMNRSEILEKVRKNLKSAGRSRMKPKLN